MFSKVPAIPKVIVPLDKFDPIAFLKAQFIRTTSLEIICRCVVISKSATTPRLGGPMLMKRHRPKYSRVNEITYGQLRVSVQDWPPWAILLGVGTPWLRAVLELPHEETTRRFTPASSRLTSSCNGYLTTLISQAPVIGAGKNSLLKKG